MPIFTIVSISSHSGSEEALHNPETVLSHHLRVMAQPAFSAVGSRIEGPQASTSSPARAPVEAKIPYSLTKEYGEAR